MILNEGNHCFDSEVEEEYHRQHDGLVFGRQFPSGSSLSNGKHFQTLCHCSHCPVARSRGTSS